MLDYTIVPPSCFLCGLLGRLSRCALVVHQNSSVDEALYLFLLVPVFAQTLFTFVRRHFMTLSFFTAWHSSVIY